MIPLIIFAIGFGIMTGLWCWKSLEPQTSDDLMLSSAAAVMGIIVGAVIFLAATKIIDVIITTPIPLWWLH